MLSFQLCVRRRDCSSDQSLQRRDGHMSVQVPRLVSVSASTSFLTFVADLLETRDALTTES